MKIIVIEPSGFLATFQYAHNLANTLSENGHAVKLATGIDFETKKYPRTYEAIEIFDRFRPRPIRITKFIISLYTFDPEIIHIQGHSHPGSYLLIWLFFKLFTRAKIIYTAQDIIPKIKKRHHRITLKILYKVVSHIFVNATQNKEKLLKLFPDTREEDITVIPLAYLTAFIHEDNPNKPEFIPENRKVILFFGNIEPRKGISVLLKAFKRVLKNVPDAFLVIAGKPFEDMQHYKNEISQLGINSHLCLKDEYLPLKEIPGLFTFSKLLVLPYTQGGSSGVIATAYTFGKPIIASDIGGFSEVIKDEVTGLLVPPKNVEQLAEAITRILTEKELQKTLDNGVKTMALMNSWPEIAKRTETVYRSLLEGTN